ncbi:histidine--tRNA ligase [Candidatus Micrarchaeota archaeon]|nr:histidine--tRNA ligase [Candidatus Micrarchaeota archaeon]
MSNFQLPRGMRDIMPEEMVKREYVYQKIKEVLKNCGFSLLEASTLESLETLVAKSGELIKNEVYWFKDKAERDVGLRFDLTVGLARIVATNPELVKPLRLASISNMFRYDEPQFARYRCFYQWDAEVFGCEGVLADAEVISVTCSILESLGLNEYEVKISNRKLIEGLLVESGIPESKIPQVLRFVDKLAKLDEKGKRGEMEKLGLNEKQFGVILDLSKQGGSFRNVLKSFKEIKNEKVEKGLKELEDLASALEAYGKLKNCVVDLGIVRGIDYYTGIVFEVYDLKSKDLGAIAGGGRFDDLVGMYGKETPATGIAGGIERLLLSLERSKLLPEIRVSPKFFVIPVSESVKYKAISIAQEIRNLGISCEVDLLNKKLGKQMEYCDKKSIPYALILGEKELLENKIKVKNMKSGEEKFLSIDRLEELRSLP